MLAIHWTRSAKIFGDFALCSRTTKTGESASNSKLFYTCSFWHSLRAFLFKILFVINIKDIGIQLINNIFKFLRIHLMINQHLSWIILFSNIFSIYTFCFHFMFLLFKKRFSWQKNLIINIYWGKLIFLYFNQ